MSCHALLVGERVTASAEIAPVGLLDRVLEPHRPAVMIGPAVDEQPFISNERGCVLNAHARIRSSSSAACTGLMDPSRKP